MDTPCVDQPAAEPSGVLADVIELLSDLGRRGHRFLLLRPRPFTTEVAFSAGDYDFLLDERQRPAFIAAFIDGLMERRLAFEVKSPPDAAHAKSAFYIRDPALDAWMTVEFWHAVVIDGGARGAHLRWVDLEPYLEQRDGGFALPNALAALIYATHLRTKRKDVTADAVKARLDTYVAQSTVSSVSVGTRLERDALALMRALQRGDVDAGGAGRSAVRLLQRAGILGPLAPRRRYLAHQILRTYPRRATGVLTRRVVAVVGPDGSGKSTLVQCLADALPAGLARPLVFKQFFRKRLAYRALMRVRRGSDRRGRNLWDERHGLVIFAMSLPAFVITVLANRGGIVLLDRYFYDVLMVGVRESSEPSTGAVRAAMFALVPRPRLVVSVLADHTETSSRDGQLTVAGFEAYRRQLVAAIARRPPVWFSHLPRTDGIDASVGAGVATLRRAGLT